MIAEDDPITLREACTLFPQAHLTVSTLRAENRRSLDDISDRQTRLHHAARNA
jgi:hypothetical protein